MCIYTRVHTHIAHTRVHIPTHTAHKYACTWTHARTHTMHTHTRGHTPHMHTLATHIQVHTYAHTLTHANTHADTHTHTYARIQNWWAENVCCQMSSLYSWAPCPLPGQKKKGSNPDLPKKMELGEGVEEKGMVAHPVVPALRRLMEAMGSPVTGQPGLQSWTPPQINNKTTKHLMFQTVANQELERHDSWADLTWGQ